MARAHSLKNSNMYVFHCVGMKLLVRGVVSLTFKSVGHNIYLYVHKHVNELRQNDKSQLTFYELWCRKGGVSPQETLLYRLSVYFSGY